MLPKASGDLPIYDVQEQRWYIFVECIRPIAEDEEVRINYSKKYYTHTETNESGDDVKFLNFEYYSGITGVNLETLRKRLIFTCGREEDEVEI